MISKAFTCNCGCGNTLVIHIFDDSISLFFAEACDYRAIRDFFDYIKGHKCLSDVLLTDNDFDEIANLLTSVICENTPVENYSHIKFNYDKDFGYSIELYNDDKFWHFLKHPGYVYSLEINREMQLHILEEIAAARAKKASHTTAAAGIGD